MPTFFSHALIPLIASKAVAPRRISNRLLIAAMIAAVLPDGDVLHSAIGISKDHILGHRGVSHSVGFAVLLGLAAMTAARSLATRRWIAFLAVFLAVLSHGLADMMTNGGRGVALLWPLDPARYFFPFRPIEVSPIDLGRFLSKGPLEIFQSEILYLLLPLSIAVLAIRLTGAAMAASRQPD